MSFSSDPSGPLTRTQTGAGWGFSFNPAVITQELQRDERSQPVSFSYLLSMMNYETDIYDETMFSAAGRVILAELSYAILTITHLIEAIAYFFLALLAQCLAQITPVNERDDVRQWKDIATDYGHFGSRALAGTSVSFARFFHIGG